MKKSIKKNALTLLVLIVAVVAIVEFEKWRKCCAGPCEDGVCTKPSGALFIDPFPKELIPAKAVTNQPNMENDNE